MQDKPRYRLHVSFYILCIAMIMAPMLRGSVHMWAKTLIQMAAILGLMGIVIWLPGRNEGYGRRLKGEAKSLYFPIFVPVVLLFAFSVPLSLAPDMTFEAGQMLVTYMAFFFITVQVVQTRYAERSLFYAIIAAGVFMAVFGILKRFDLNFLGLWEYPDVSPSTFHNSLTGPYVNRNHMAGFLELAIFPVISLFLLRKRSREEKLGISLVLLLFLASLVLTLSRGGWMSTACGLLFLIGVQVSRRGIKKNGLWAGAVLAVFMGIVILVNTPVVQRITTLTEGSAIDSMSGRIRTWKGTWNMVKDYPLTGTGPGTFSHVYPRYQLPGSPYLERYTHNDYLQFVSEAGIWFIPLVIWLIYRFYRAGFEKLKSRSRQTRGLTLGAMSGCTAILVHSVSDFNLQIPGNALIFTVWAAFVMRPVRSGQRVEKQGDEAMVDSP